MVSLAMGADEIPLLAPGKTWQQMPAGTRFRTQARTLTETDLISFVSLYGFTEALFLDARHGAKVGYRGRLVPGALTYCLAEGLVLQTNVVQGTGVGFLAMELSVVRPVYVGDTIAVVVTVLESRVESHASQSPARGVVRSENVVVNQEGDEVLRYAPVRLVAGGEG